jgi:site-specific DNA-methyltransferase (adenine-specific)
MKDLLNKIHHADCLEFMKQLPDKSIDLVLTDPPFGMNFQSGRRVEKHNKIEGDDNLDWLEEWFEVLADKVKLDAMIYIFCSFHKVDVFKQVCEKHFPVKNILIWHKNNHGSGDLFGDYAPQYEMVIYCNLGGKHLTGRRDSNILQFSRTQNELHPTQKPVDLIKYLASKSLDKGVCLDSFSGSGTTALACHDLGLDFICIEKDEDYFKASVERLEKHKRQLKLL